MMIFTLMQGVGLNLENALAFWRAEFSQKVLLHRNVFHFQHLELLQQMASLAKKELNMAFRY